VCIPAGVWKVNNHIPKDVFNLENPKFQIKTEKGTEKIRGGVTVFWFNYQPETSK